MGGEIFVWVMVGIFALLFVLVILLGLFYPGSGAEQLDWKPTRSPELEAQNEVDDLDQMLEAANERRRRRGDAELTEAAVEARVMEDQRRRRAMRDAYLADQETEGQVAADVAQMLARVNDGRRRRGEPELTADEYRAEIERGPNP
jgi:hypothetical protein